MSGLRYLSVCSGIEAATMAWHPLGWTPAGFAEIEPFPSAVLAYHYGSNMPGQPLSKNGVPNFGDFTQIQTADCGPVDLLVGGTPCQDFSVAGLRKGLAGERGQLTLEFLRLAQRLRPKRLVWENVPGVLSQNGGRAFGAFLGGLVELGYGFAYRVLDAQYVRVDGFGRAVPQRRRRVFVVGYLGDWRRPAAVLFEREGLSGHPAPRRQSGTRAAASLTRGAESSGCGGYAGRRQEDDVNIVAFVGNDTRGSVDIATAVNAHGGPCGRLDFESETFVVAPPLTHNPYGDHESREGLLVAHSLRAEGFDASEDGSGRGTPIVPVPYTLAIRGRGDSHQLEYRQDGTSNAILTPNGGRAGIGVGAIAFAENQRNEIREMSVSGALASIRRGDAKNETLLAHGWRVRRLIPRECERLQGFPDDFTAILFRGKPAADGPRYKVLGNSMAVNCMRWIGRRIETVEGIAAQGCPA